MQSILYRKLLLASTAMLFMPFAASALPTGGSVSSGSAAISNPTSSSTLVTQSTPSAVINWTGFNTSKGQQVTINDTHGSNSVTLNRVSGAATTFDGALSSNGNVWVINPSGILIGSTGTINTAGFLATTSNITDANFMAGKYSFTPGGGAATASVANQGTITVAETGLAALVAPNVANSGTINFTGNVINAKVGTIALASGDTFTVDLAGDGLINLAASNAVTSQSLSNTGTLNAANFGNPGAAGGTVEITAAQASKVVDNVINLNGLIEAQNLTGSGDTINYGATFTPASNGSNFTLTAPGDITVNSGSAIGGAKTPSVDVTLESTGSGNITVNKATIDTNGGDVYLDGLNNFIYNNQDVNLNGATINAGGGNVVIFANNTISAQSGSITAGGVTIFAEGSGNAASDTKGLYLNNFDITSTNGGGEGGIYLEGYAPQFSSGSTYGVRLYDSYLNAEKGNITISGYGSQTSNGATTGLSIYGTYVFDSGGAITLLGAAQSDGTYSPTYVNGGSANGTMITQSVIGGPDTQSVDIQGAGGYASGYASEGVVINNLEVEASGNPSGKTPSTITVQGIGGVGTSTIGVDASGGRVDMQLSNNAGNGSININGFGGISSGTSADAGVVFSGNIISDIVGHNVNITGTGGYGDGSTNGAGVYLSGVLTEATNTKITGQGAMGTGSQNYGVELAGANNFYDYGSIQFTGTGVGSAADIEANESAAPAILNNIYVESGSTYSFTGTRNKRDLNDIAITGLISE